MEKQCLSALHERRPISERMDFPKYLQNSYSSLCLGDSAGSSSQLKRKRILKAAESDSDSSSDSDDEPNDEDIPVSTPDNTACFRIPKKGQRVWDTKQMDEWKMVVNNQTGTQNKRVEGNICL